MPAAQQQSSQGGDNSLAPLWITAGIFLLGMVIWYFAHEYIVAFVLTLKLYEAKLISLFTSDVYSIEHVIQSIAPTTYSEVSMTQLIDISDSVGNYFRHPVALILIVLGVVLFLSNSTTRFKKTYTMQRLLDEEKVDWPQITPVVKLDLVNEDIDKGPWAMALSPMQFAKKHNLLRLEKMVSSDALLSSKAKILASISREEAYRVFSLQLGRFWTGTDDLNIYMKAIFAIFAARVDGNRDEAAALTAHIGASTLHGKLDFAGVQELLDKHKNNKQVQRVIQKHAYVLTVMASLLELARTDGVLASADFLWLKPIDRQLWFMLSTVGRQTPFCEIAGPYAHWLAEKELGRKLFVPMVDEAVNALGIAVKDILYKPDEEEEQTQAQNTKTTSSSRQLSA